MPDYLFDVVRFDQPTERCAVNGESVERARDALIRQLSKEGRHYNLLLSGERTSKGDVMLPGVASLPQ